MKKIGENIWVFDKEFYLAGAEFGNRMTVIKLNDDRLWIHSPIDPNDEIVEVVTSLGKVDTLVTPNCWHSLYVGAWLKIFPQASCWVPRCEFKKCRFMLIKKF